MKEAGRDSLDKRPGESCQWRSSWRSALRIVGSAVEARSRSNRCVVHDWLCFSEPGFQGDRREMKPSYRGPALDDFLVTNHSDFNILRLDSGAITPGSPLKRDNKAITFRQSSFQPIRAAGPTSE